MINRGLMIASIFSKINKLNKGEVMYNYKVDDETTRKVVSTYNSNIENSEIKNLIDKIVDIDSNYRNIDIPDYNEPKFEKLEDVVVDTDKIASDARDSLSAYKSESINKINNDYDAEKKKLDSKLVDINKSAIEEKSNVKQYFDNAKEDAKNNAITRGIGRSSIIINALDAFDKGEIEEFNRIDSELTDNINAIDFQLTSLSQQKEQALNDFDIAYAVKLNDKINSLTSELQKKQNEVIKYNNQISEKESKYKQDYDEFVADIEDKNRDNNKSLVDLVAKYGSNVVSAYRKNQIFEAVDSFFEGVDRAKVIEILNTNDNLKSALGSLYQDVVERYKK